MSTLLLRHGLLDRTPLVPAIAAGYVARVQASTAFNDLVAWYQLDGSPIVDTRGNVGLGSIVGDVSFTTDALPDAGQTAADFAGTNGYVVISDDLDLHLSTGAIHFAVDIDSLPGVGQSRFIISKEGSGLTDQDFVVMLYNNNGAQELRIQFVLSGVPQSATIAGIVPGQHWVTINFGNSQNLDIYHNRTLVDSNPSYTGGINNNTRQLLFGAANLGSGATGFFDGKLAHVQIYGRRLTQAEINFLSFPLFSGQYDHRVSVTNPVGYWKFNNNLLDSVGSNHGQLGAGSEAYAAALPDTSNQAFNCGAGVNWVSVPHAAALKPAVGSYMIWFKPSSLHQAGVIGADASGLALGDAQLIVFADGKIRAHFQTATVQHQVETSAAYYAADQIVHALVTFGGSGFSLYLDGNHIGTNTSYTNGLGGNTHAWNFGRSQTAAGDFNGVIDEVAIWDRVLTQTEIWTLAQLVPPPVPPS